MSDAKLNSVRPHFRLCTSQATVVLHLSFRVSLLRVPQLLEQAQAELVKRTHFFQKLVKKLHEKLRLSEEREKVMRDAEFGTRSSGPRSTVDRTQVRAV